MDTTTATTTTTDTGGSNSPAVKININDTKEADIKPPTILFSSKSKEYKYLSNDYILGIHLYGKDYWHIEGFLLSQKFQSDSKLSERIRKLTSPMACRRVAEESYLPKEKEERWNKRIVMIEARVGILTKFLTNGDYGKRLLSTDNAILVYNNPDDAYWGCGKNMKGDNMLGKILMETRTILKGLTGRD